MSIELRCQFVWAAFYCSNQSFGTPVRNRTLSYWFGASLVAMTSGASFTFLPSPIPVSFVIGEEGLDPQLPGQHPGALPIESTDTISQTRSALFIHPGCEGRIRTGEFLINSQAPCQLGYLTACYPLQHCPSPLPVIYDTRLLDTYEQSPGFNKCPLLQEGHKRRYCRDTSL